MPRRKNSSRQTIPWQQVIIGAGVIAVIGIALYAQQAGVPAYLKTQLTGATPGATPTGTPTNQCSSTKATAISDDQKEAAVSDTGFTPNQAKTNAMRKARTAIDAKINNQTICGVTDSLYRELQNNADFTCKKTGCENDPTAPISCKRSGRPFCHITKEPTRAGTTGPWTAEAQCQIKCNCEQQCRPTTGTTPTKPQLSVFGNNSAIAEGNDRTKPNAIEFNFTLDRALDKNISVTVNTKDATATAPSDYAKVVDKKVYIYKGNKTSSPFKVLITPDTTRENYEELFELHISGVPDDIILSTPQALGVIGDDDLSTPTPPAPTPRR